MLIQMWGPFLGAFIRSTCVFRIVFITFDVRTGRALTRGEHEASVGAWLSTLYLCGAGADKEQLLDLSRACHGLPRFCVGLLRLAEAFLGFVKLIAFAVACVSFLELPYAALLVLCCFSAAALLMLSCCCSSFGSLLLCCCFASALLLL